MMNVTETNLCVGGPADGQTIAFAGAPVLRYQSDGEISHYQKETLAGEMKAYRFWRHEDTSVDDALAYLFASYGR